MEAHITSRACPETVEVFDARACLESTGVQRTVVEYGRGQTIFRQGDVCEGVFYIQSGSVKLCVLSRAGREAVVGMLGPGDFFGEGCLAGQALRMGSAAATIPTSVLLVSTEQMSHMLHQQHVMSERFLSYLLARNIRIEEDLVDQLFNCSEKRLARMLLLLAHYGEGDKPQRVVPVTSQATLAEMVGASRPKVNFFLNKFKRLGFIEYSDERPIKINQSLLSVVLHD